MARWFLRGKTVVRAPFKMFFGTLETECKQEFMDAKERGSSSIQQSMAEEEAARRIASACLRRACMGWKRCWLRPIALCRSGSVLWPRVRGVRVAVPMATIEFKLKGAGVALPGTCACPTAQRGGRGAAELRQWLQLRVLVCG